MCCCAVNARESDGHVATDRRWVVCLRTVCYGSFHVVCVHSFNHPTPSRTHSPHVCARPRTAIAIIKQSSSGHTTLAATATHNMSTVLASMKRYDEALAAGIEAYKLRLELLGPKNIETAQSACSIGGILNWMERCGYDHDSSLIVVCEAAVTSTWLFWRYGVSCCACYALTGRPSVCRIVSTRFELRGFGQRPSLVLGSCHACPEKRYRGTRQHTGCSATTPLLTCGYEAEVAV